MSRRRRTSQSVAQPRFWGDPRRPGLPPDQVRPAADPSAVVRSLGSPPLSGHERAGDLYLEAVYEKAVGLAAALAAAGGLLDQAGDDGA